MGGWGNGGMDAWVHGCMGWCGHAEKGRIQDSPLRSPYTWFGGDMTGKGRGEPCVRPFHYEIFCFWTVSWFRVSFPRARIDNLRFLLR